MSISSNYLLKITTPDAISRRNPDASPTKLKMVYAGTSDAVKKSLQGFAKDIQANDVDDVSFESMRNLFAK
jgi:hypothetical protein